jgi:serine/threonine protein kinase
MALQVGQLFGNYQIVRLLGEGGFGEVYLAENPLIERRAAVKVLHVALTQNIELVRRFLNEARAASAIRHPNIVEVFDAGITPEGAPYILMEFLDGISLQKRLADVGRLDIPQTLEIANQTASALVAAHDAGIVHRDLKPENLFLIPDRAAPSGERVKVLDFGIAKIKHSGNTGGTVRTQTGLIMGSPAYMSPEQCKDSADVDLRSDIYSFAIILYEMLAGRTPYLAPNGTELLVMHLTETPRPLREFAPAVPIEVESAISRALSRTREDRFDSMTSFMEALRGNVSGDTAVLSWPWPSKKMPTAGPSLVTPVERIATLPASTTFSRATGEVGEAESDEVLLASARPRRWPLLVVGGMAVCALALFLILRPRNGSLPQAMPGTAIVTTMPVVVASPSPYIPKDLTAIPDPVRPIVFSNSADGGVEHSAVPSAQPAKKLMPANVPSIVTQPPSPKRERAAESRASAKPASKKESSEEEWIAH